MLPKFVKDLSGAFVIGGVNRLVTVATVENQHLNQPRSPPSQARGSIGIPVEQSAVGGITLRTEPIIDPFLRLLKESVFSFGFCCKSINCSSHNESPKPSGFGIFNSSSCAPVKSGGTSLHYEFNGVPTISVRFCHRSYLIPGPKQKKQGAGPKPRHCSSAAFNYLSR